METSSKLPELDFDFNKTMSNYVLVREISLLMFGQTPKRILKTTVFTV